MNTRKNPSLSNYEDWMNRKWRPLMGYMYIAVCTVDFIVFPILWAVFQAHIEKNVEPWNPLTLQGAGLFHLAMGAVLGVAAWSRGKEKLAGVSGNPYASPIDEEYVEQPVRPKYQKYSQQTYTETKQVYTTKSGKLAPVIEEPEL